MKIPMILPFALLLCSAVFATEPHKKAAAPKAKKQATAATKPVQKAAPVPEMSADDSLLAEYGVRPRHLEPQVGMYMAPSGVQNSNPYGQAEPAVKAKRKKNQ